MWPNIVFFSWNNIICFVNLFSLGFLPFEYLNIRKIRIIYLSRWNCSLLRIYWIEEYLYIYIYMYHSLCVNIYIHVPYGYAWNAHRMFITYIHRTLESRNTKNTYDFLVQVRNFLLLLSLKVLRHKERDTHSFYSGFFICPSPPSRAAPVARKFV